MNGEETKYPSSIYLTSSASKLKNQSRVFYINLFRILESFWGMVNPFIFQLIPLRAQLSGSFIVLLSFFFFLEIPYLVAAWASDENYQRIHTIVRREIEQKI